jgi:hypothetical protein
MVDNGMMAEIREKAEEDERGREKKGSKTPFVILTRLLK